MGLALPVWAQDGGILAPSVDTHRTCLRRVARVVGWGPGDLQKLVGPEGPQAHARAWLEPGFHANNERTDIWNQNGFVRAYAAFFAGRVNRQPPNNPHEAIYTYAAAWVLASDLPWKELFTRRMTCSADGCTDEPKAPAIGVFGSGDWNNLYAGAAPDGAMLRGAANLLRAMTGLVLKPSPSNMAANNGASGRMRAECRGCHYDGAYALDHVTGLFYWKKAADRPVVVAQTPTAQVLLNQKTYASLDGFVEDLANSDTFRAWNCQLLFEYAYGRGPRACEAATYTACVASLRESGRLRDALSLIVEDPAFCAELP